MAFVAEDGTGKSDSNSYTSVSYTKTYLSDRYGVTDPLYLSSDADIERFLIQSTQYLDSRYRLRYKGYKTNYNQALSWPRLDVTDADGYYVDGNVIPTELQQATIEIARRFRAGDILLPDTDPGAVKLERVEGAVTVEYFEHTAGVPNINQVKMLLSGLIMLGNPVIRS
jgi:hypothetical protein